MGEASIVEVAFDREGLRVVASTHEAFAYIGTIARRVRRYQREAQGSRSFDFVKRLESSEQPLQRSRESLVVPSSVCQSLESSARIVAVSWQERLESQIAEQRSSRRAPRHKSLECGQIVGCDSERRKSPLFHCVLYV